MIEAIQPTERLWRMVKTWRLWVGPEGYENRYSHLADTLEKALTAHSELAELRAKLAAAEEWQKRPIEQTAFAPLFFALEADRDALARQNADLRAEVAQLRGSVAAANYTADLSSGREFDAVMEYGELLKQNAALRAALEEIVGLNGSAAYLPPHKPTAGKAIGIARSALALTPPAALDDLRRRERSIGAEEELRRLAAEDCDTVFPDDLPHVTQNQLIDRADAIAAERKERG